MSMLAGTIDMYQEREAEKMTVLERLEARHSARKHEAEQRSTQPSESSANFMNSFFERATSVKDSLRISLESTDDKEAQKAFAQLSTSVLELEREAAEACYFLPAYDQRSVNAAILKIKQDLESAKRSRLPQKKFSFTKKTTSQGQAPSISSRESPQLTCTNEDLAVADDSDYLLDSIDPERIIKGKVGTTFVLSADRLAGGDVVLANLQDCTVFLLGTLPALWIHKVANCRVYGGPVLGAAFVDGATNCTLMLHSFQARIHRSHGCHVYLNVRSQPIIEHCSDMQFAPNQFDYPGCKELLQEYGLDGVDSGSSTLWSQVKDFGWIKATQSPNWSIVPEEQRVAPPVAPPSLHTAAPLPTAPLSSSHAVG